MKKFLGILAIAGVLVACDNSGNTGATSDTATTTTTTTDAGTGTGTATGTVGADTTGIGGTTGADTANRAAGDTATQTPR